MAARTKSALSSAVLVQLRVTGAGETPSAEDAALVEDRYDAKLAEWRDRGVVWWPNTGRSVEEIPLEIFQPLVDLMENEIGHSFGRDNPAVERRAIEERLLGNLRRNLSRRASGEATAFVVY